jgi:hypothetical protein
VARWDRKPGARERRGGEWRGLGLLGLESRRRVVWIRTVVRAVARTERMRLSGVTLGATTSLAPRSDAVNCWSRVAAELHEIYDPDVVSGRHHCIAHIGPTSRWP